MADKKTLVEEALLQMENLQEAITENAKGILASTMKEEISELVKESLEEEEIEMSDTEMSEQEEVLDLDIDVDDDGEDDIEDALEDLGLDMGDDMESDNDEELELGDEEMLMTDLPGDDLEVDDEEEVLLPLDLTGASDDEILKVFKAMGEDDGVIVTQDEEGINLKDDEADVEYEIRLESEDKEEALAEMEEEEVVYEIELGEDDGNYFGDAAEDDYSQIEKLKKDAHHDAEEHHKEEHYEEYGGKKGDESKSRRDYEANEGKYGGNKGDESKSRRDYEANEGKYGGNKGDESKSRRDYEANEGKYGGNKGDESKSRRDYEANEGKYGGNKGDESKSPQKITKLIEGNVVGGNKGDESKSHRDYEANEGSVRSNVNGRMTNKKPNNFPKSLKRPAQRNESVNKEIAQLREKNEEYRKALNIFKEKLNEVAVFNSNLAYATRLFTEHSTTKQEKINILRRFDGVETIKESKSLYKSLKEDLGGKGQSVVTESVQSKVQKSPSNGSANNLIESKTYENPQFLRMKDLMGKLK